VVVGGLTFYPLGCAIWLSFSAWALTGSHWIGLANLPRLFSDRLFWLALANTFFCRLEPCRRHLVVAGAGAVDETSDVRGARAPGDRRRTTGRALDAVSGMVGLVWLLPLITALLTAMRHLPRKVEESARVDGYSWIGIWWRIALPMSRPAQAAAGIYAFIESWREFFVAPVMINSQAIRTVPVGLALFRSDTPGVTWGEIMASALTAAVPALVVSLLLQRQFIAGCGLPSACATSR